MRSFAAASLFRPPLYAALLLFDAAAARHRFFAFRRYAMLLVFADTTIPIAADDVYFDVYFALSVFLPCRVTAAHRLPRYAAIAALICCAAATPQMFTRYARRAAHAFTMLDCLIYYAAMLMRRRYGATLICFTPAPLDISRHAARVSMALCAMSPPAVVLPCLMLLLPLHAYAMLMRAMLPP